jgi:hypothetical protein
MSIKRSISSPVKQIDIFEGFYKDEQWTTYKLYVTLPKDVHEWLQEFKASGVLEKPIPGKSVYGYGIVFARAIQAYLNFWPANNIRLDPRHIWAADMVEHVYSKTEHCKDKQNFDRVCMRVWASPACGRFLQKAAATKPHYKQLGTPYRRHGLPSIVAAIFIWAYLQQTKQHQKKHVLDTI